MSDRLILTLVAASAPAAKAILCCSAAAVALIRSAGAFLINSLIISLLARSRAVFPFYTCISVSDSEQRNCRN